MSIGLTLALPEDLLGFGPRNIMKLQDGRRILRFDRGLESGAKRGYRPNPISQPHLTPTRIVTKGEVSAYLAALAG